jgi:hypothetical protein
MKRTIIIFLVVIALLTMAQECQTTDNNKNTVNPFLGGQSGLTVQFVDDAPPPEVFDSNAFPFNIEVKLLNTGETDIKKEDVKITLSGLNPTDFGKTTDFFIKSGIDEDVLANYKDAEGNIVKATDTIVVFPGLNFKDKLTGNFPTKVRADVCYAYSTQALASGCLKPDPTRESSNDICLVKEKKTIYNSGAPVQVDSFEELPSGTDKVRYLFTIKHVGTGAVYAPGSKCPSNIDSRESINKLHFKLEFLGDSTNADFVCSGLVGGAATEGDILLRDGSADVRCTQQKASTIIYTQRMQVTLNYDYLQTADKDILVKKSD